MESFVEDGCIDLVLGGEFITFTTGCCEDWVDGNDVFGNANDLFGVASSGKILLKSYRFASEDVFASRALIVSSCCRSCVLEGATVTHDCCVVDFGGGTVVVCSCCLPIDDNGTVVVLSIYFPVVVYQ